MTPPFYSQKLAKSRARSSSGAGSLRESLIPSREVLAAERARLDRLDQQNFTPQVNKPEPRARRPRQGELDFAGVQRRQTAPLTDYITNGKDGDKPIPQRSDPEGVEPNKARKAPFEHIPAAGEGRIGVRLARARALMGVSRAELAAVAGYADPMQITLIEEGRASIAPERLALAVKHLRADPAAFGVKPKKRGPAFEGAEKPKKERIGFRLAQIRQLKGVTQEALARAIGYKHATAICLIETCKRRLPAFRLALAAQYLGCTAEEILGEPAPPAERASRAPPRAAARRGIRALARSV